MSDLHQEQLSHIADIVGTYSADPDDPTPLEVLLVLQEICHILEIPHYEMVSIFSKRTLHALRTWGKPTAATPGPHRPAPRLDLVAHRPAPRPLPHPRRRHHCPHES